VTSRNALIAAAAALVLLRAGGAMAGDPDALAFSAGAFDINDDKTAAEFRVEYRTDWRRYILTPMVGLMANSDGGFYGYGGVFIDIYFGRRFVGTPNFAVGGYRQGGSKDLGSTIEFRSGIEFAYRFDDRSRLGIAFHHISNASIDDNNPGTESLVLTYSIPLARFRK